MTTINNKNNKKNKKKEEEEEEDPRSCNVTEKNAIYYDQQNVRIFGVRPFIKLQQNT